MRTRLPAIAADSSAPRGRPAMRLYGIPHHDSPGSRVPGRPRRCDPSAMTDATTHLMRELDHRSSDGIDVRLLWCERDGRVLVAVSDTKTGEAFSIEVREGERALDVFHHPYAYAASRDAAAASPRNRAASAA